MPEERPHQEFGETQDRFAIILGATEDEISRLLDERSRNVLADLPDLHVSLGERFKILLGRARDTFQKILSDDPKA